MGYIVQNNLSRSVNNINNVKISKKLFNQQKSFLILKYRIFSLHYLPSILRISEYNKKASNQGEKFFWIGARQSNNKFSRFIEFDYTYSVFIIMLVLAEKLFCIKHPAKSTA